MPIGALSGRTARSGHRCCLRCFSFVAMWTSVTVPQLGSVSASSPPRAVTRTMDATANQASGSVTNLQHRHGHPPLVKLRVESPWSYAPGQRYASLLEPRRIPLSHPSLPPLSLRAVRRHVVAPACSRRLRSLMGGGCCMHYVNPLRYISTASRCELCPTSPRRITTGGRGCGTEWRYGNQLGSGM